MSDEMKYDYGTPEEKNTAGNSPDYGGPVEYGYGREQKDTASRNSFEPVDYGSQNQYQGASGYGSQNQYQGASDYGQAAHYEDPYANGVQEEPAGFAVASLILGIVSIVLSCTYVNIVTGIIAIVLGAIHLSKRRTRRGMAIAGIVLSIVSIVILVVLLAIGLAIIGNSPEILDQIMNQM